MLKISESVKEAEERAVDALRELLSQVPAVKVEAIEREAARADGGVDIVAHLSVSKRRHDLLCQVKANGQPRHVRLAVLQLRDYLAHDRRPATPVLIAPYLSPEGRALCREQEVGFLDFEGNVRLVFDGVFIERSVPNKPSAERRELRSLFRPKSAQVLRVMLRDPRRAWRVTELAEAAGVSLGHVSNVRSGLLGREWAEVADEGVRLRRPDEVLDAWRDVYEPPAGARLGFYTTLHGSGFEVVARQALRSGPHDGRAAFASFSAAHWLAPYGRTGTQYFYADEVGLERLRSALKLTSAAKGENVVVTLLAEDGVLRDAVEPAPGAVCTSAVQTYLDLAASGERGREAAEHLRQERLRWPG
jgi:hypothetical protein